MKKLIMAAAIVCAAAFAQAATVNWTIAGVKDANGNAPTSGWAVMAFYTEVDAGTSAIVDAINDGKADILSFDKQELSVSMKKGKVAAHNAEATTLTDTTKNYDFYFVVFNDADASKATQYVIASALDKGYSGMDGTFPVSGDFSSLPAWQQVAPEPTSGLLALLGMAGLALRRRRA